MNDIPVISDTEGRIDNCSGISTADSGRTDSEQHTSNDSSEEEELQTVLQDYLKEDENCSILTTQNEYSELQLIYIQTSRMKRAVENFPEVLMLDFLPKVTKSKMVLATIMAQEKESGEGHVCAHAFLAKKRLEILRAFLSRFQLLNPSTTSSKVFFIHHELNEIHLVKEIWPKIDLVLCRFHVLETLRLKSRSYDMSTMDRANLSEIFQEMVHSHSEEYYLESYRLLKSTCPQEFLEYYNQNWHGIRKLWVESSLPIANHILERSMKPLEDYHQNVKDFLKPGLSVGVSVQKLLHYGEDQLHSNMFGSIVKSELSHVRRPFNMAAFNDLCETATLCAANLMFSEVTELSDMNVLSSEFIGNLVRVQVGEILNTVNVSLTRPSCTCWFSDGTQLPCRHIFYVLNEMQSPFLPNLIPPQWTKQPIGLLPFSSLVPQLNGMTMEMERSEKFRNIQRMFEEMSTMCSDIPDVDFDRRYALIFSIYQAWQKGKNICLVKEEPDS